MTALLKIILSVCQSVLAVGLLGAAFSAHPSACDGSPSDVQHMGAMMALLGVIALLSGFFLMEAA